MTGPIGRTWSTALDLDFTAQGNQTFGADGNFTFAGFTWNKQNTANEAAAMANVAGTGLVVQPASATNYDRSTRTLPTLWLPFAGIPGLQTVEWASSVRVWVHVASYNGAASFDDAVCAVDSNALGAVAFQAARGITTLGTGHQGFTMQMQSDGSSFTNGGGTNFQSGADLTMGGTNNVMVLDIPQLGDIKCRTTFGGFGLASGKTWPDPQDLQISVISLGTPTTGISAWVGNGGVSFNVQANALGIALGAKRQGSATALNVTYGHLRVDYRN